MSYYPMPQDASTPSQCPTGLTSVPVKTEGVLVQRRQPEAASFDWEGALRELAQDDHAVREGLVDGLTDQLFPFALWLCGSRTRAEEAVQDVFLRLLERRGRLGEIRDPRAYLLRVVRSSVASFAAQQARHPTVGLNAVSGDELLVQPERGLEDASTISALLLRLPVAQRETLYLRYYCGLKFREIGVACDVSTFTAAARYRLAMARLRRWLKVALHEQHVESSVEKVEHETR